MVSGRLITSGERKTSKPGHDYAIASLAVDVEQDQPAWEVRAVAFGHAVEDLAGMYEGQQFFAIGRLEWSSGPGPNEDLTPNNAWTLLIRDIVPVFMLKEKAKELGMEPGELDGAVKGLVDGAFGDSDAGDDLLGEPSEDDIPF